MNVTVIISTYNRGQKLLDALRSLEQQVYTDFKVLIVNDGSTDNTKEILDAEISNLNLNITVLHQPNAGRAKVRNRGAKEADDGLLVFMDDDMRHDNRAIQMHLNHHMQKPQSILVGNQIEDIKHATTDIQRYRAYLSNLWSENLATHPGPMNEKNLHITAANFSAPRSLFLELGGFDERLTDTEDYDLAMRAYVAGIPVYYNPNIIGWHDDFITCTSYVARRRQYLKSHARLKELKPDLYASFHRRPIDASQISKRLVYKIFRGKRWPYLVDANIFALLPRRVRYRIYEAIIYVNSVPE